MERIILKLKRKRRKENIATDGLSCESEPLIMEYIEALKNGIAIDWLQSNGSELARPKYYECLVNFHIVEDEEDLILYNTYIKAHPENMSSIRYYEKSWIQIEEFIEGIENYEKYLGFDFIESKMDFKLLKFTDTQTCYSIPLLRAMQDVFRLKNSDSFLFTKAILPISHDNDEWTLEERIVFQIPKKGTIIFDLSDNPSLWML